MVLYGIGMEGKVLLYHCKYYIFITYAGIVFPTCQLVHTFVHIIYYEGFHKGWYTNDSLDFIRVLCTNRCKSKYWESIYTILYSFCRILHALPKIIGWNQSWSSCAHTSELWSNLCRLQSKMLLNCVYFIRKKSKFWFIEGVV